MLGVELGIEEGFSDGLVAGTNKGLEEGIEDSFIDGAEDSLLLGNRLGITKGCVDGCWDAALNVAFEDDDVYLESINKGSEGGFEDRCQDRKDDGGVYPIGIKLTGELRYCPILVHKPSNC
jgi:hypothetical protein